MSEKKNEKEISFEDKIKKLEAIVSELESGEVALETAIDKLYKTIPVKKRTRR